MIAAVIDGKASQLRRGPNTPTELITVECADCIKYARVHELAIASGSRLCAGQIVCSAHFTPAINSA